MGERSPETPWRQGHVLPTDAAKKLGLVHPNADDDPLVVVISHDCDLAASTADEPFCEIISGCHLDEPNGIYTNAKNPRRLHLPFSAGRVKTVGDFSAIDKDEIQKESLFEFSPSENARLTPAEFSVLQTWLAARYRRASFTDSFVSRFKQRRFYDRFRKAIEGSRAHILAVMFDIDDGQEIERQEIDDTYSLSIYLVFNVTEDPHVAEIAATEAATQIEALCRKTFFVKDRWQNIECKGCVAVSESIMSLYEGRLYREWEFDSLSLRDEPQGQTLRSAASRGD